jgi:hypothetical protein
MVIVKDSNSTILGDPLTFKFYIENRRPVLAPLVTMPGFGPASFPSTIHPLAPLDITLVNDKYVKYTDAGIVILPVAYDYDEDDLVYTYSKWKGTFDVAFATGTISQQTAGCRFLTPFFCYYWDASFLLPSTPIAASNNEWHKSALYVSGDPGMNCLPNQCAQYDFKPAPDDVLDIGPHTTTVTVTDRGGLTDYADAVIIVGTD